MLKPLVPLLCGVALAQSPNIEDMLRDDRHSIGDTVGNPASNSRNRYGNQGNQGNQGFYQASPTGSGNANQGGMQNANIDYGNYAKFAKKGNNGNPGGNGNQDFYQSSSTGSGSANQGKDNRPAPVNPATSIGGLMGKKSAGAMPGGMGGLMGAMTGAMGGAAGKQDSRPDMFGRKPGQSSPLGMGGAGAGGNSLHQKPNPLMDTLLSSIESRMPTNKAQATKNGAPQISQ